MKFHPSNAESPSLVTNASQTQKVKILLVGETPENLVALEAALYGLGEELVLAQSGAEALRHLLEDDFAVVLLDVRMPDMDGFETAQMIRSWPRSRHTPILFLSKYESDAQLPLGHDLGAVDFLFTPIVPQILRSKVAFFVELSRNTALLRAQAQALREQAAGLQKTEQKFRSLLEAAPDAMIMCREDGEIVLVNSRVESVFGDDRQEIVGKRIQLLVPNWSYQLPAVRDEGAELAPSCGAERECVAVRLNGDCFPVRNYDKFAASGRRRAHHERNPRHHRSQAY